MINIYFVKTFAFIFISVLRATSTGQDGRYAPCKIPLFTVDARLFVAGMLVSGFS